MYYRFFKSIEQVIQHFKAASKKYPKTIFVAGAAVNASMFCYAIDQNLKRQAWYESQSVETQAEMLLKQINNKNSLHELPQDAMSIIIGKVYHVQKTPEELAKEQWDEMLNKKEPPKKTIQIGKK